MSEDSGRKYVIPDDPADRPVRTRRAVRIIVVGPDDRVLLFEDSDPGIPGVTWWVTPGGGTDPGESERQTAVRELAEETGYALAEDELVGPLATRFAVHGYSDQILEQAETFYLARAAAFEVDISDHTEEEQITLQGHRWWTREEIAAGQAWIWPAELVQLWDRAGADEPPLELGRREESTVPVDPRSTYDAWHGEPLIIDDRDRVILARHADVMAVATDPDRYSSAVSRFLQVPNGLDGEEHRRTRELLDPFFSPQRMAALEPRVRVIADELVSDLAPGQVVYAVAGLGSTFAVRAQSAWLGWPAELEPELLAWMDENHAATRSGDLARTAAVADQFNVIIRTLLDARRGADAPDDLTTELTRLRDADGQPLSDEVLVSVLRNWTGGDLGSLALCVGVVVSWLATHPTLQEELRTADDAQLVAAIDELLRIDDPFVSNRRVTTCPVELGGRSVPAGTQVVLNWTAANRDPDVFGDPDAFAPEANAAKNLVYGIGPHVCPGRPLATLELRILTRSLLDQVRWRPADEPSVREQPPLGGFSRVPVTVERI